MQFALTCLIQALFDPPQLHVHLWRVLRPPSERRSGLHATVLPGLFNLDPVRRRRTRTALPLAERRLPPLGAKSTWARPASPCFLPCQARYANNSCPASLCSSARLNISTVTRRRSPPRGQFFHENTNYSEGSGSWSLFAQCNYRNRRSPEQQLPHFEVIRFSRKSPPPFHRRRLSVPDVFRRRRHIERDI